MRKYDYVFRNFGEIRCRETYALDKERGFALLVINKYIRMREIPRPGTCALFLKDKMIVFNVAKFCSNIILRDGTILSYLTDINSQLKDASYVENVIEVMPFSPPFESAEEEKIVQDLIVAGLTTIGFDGSPYSDDGLTRVRVVFNAKFDGPLF